MGDLVHSREELQRVNSRIQTFVDKKYELADTSLASAGFYYTRKENNIECFSCHLVLDASRLKKTEDIFQLHHDLRPSCNFSKSICRSKTFDTPETLRFEKERLETFIDWPVEWLSPASLASEGFYYLRTKDHTACAFCRGIVGSWEEGDDPRREHKRHFPFCPFINGQPVGNVPLVYSDVISSLQETNFLRTQGTDVCGHEKHSSSESSFKEKLDLRSIVKNPPSNFKSLGLKKYSGPVCPDFNTLESRISSFRKWPEKVKQDPKLLAEAGFYHIGLSDHVRCSHCGNGLRNWDADDDPWVEHARWYPDCDYLLLMKGIDFIDKARREKPPYRKLLPQVAQNVAHQKENTIQCNISDDQLSILMDLDVMKAVQSMGFPLHIMKNVLRKRVEETGLPFFAQESCIAAIIQAMDEETRQAIHSTPQSSAQSIPTREKESNGEGFSQLNASASQSVNQDPTGNEAVSMLISEISGPNTSESSQNITPYILTPPDSQGSDNGEMNIEFSLSEKKEVCCKSELNGDMKMECQGIQSAEESTEDNQCRICMDNEIKIVFLPCTHMVSCITCALALKICPICRTEIAYAIKPLKS